jgi:AcrR family transcriptional regulator
MAVRPKRPPRRSYHHGDVRGALLTAALELIREVGPAGFSLREAARMIGVDPAACYRHFRDRQEVLIAIAQEGFVRFARAFADELKETEGLGPRERLQALGRQYFCFATRQPAEFRIMFGESGLHSRDPRLRLPQVERSAYEQLEDVTGEYIRAVGLKREPAELALTFWALVHGVTRLALDGAVPLDEPRAQAVLASMLDAMFTGLEATAGKNTPKKVRRPKPAPRR